MIAKREFVFWVPCISLQKTIRGAFKLVTTWDSYPGEFPKRN